MAFYSDHILEYVRSAWMFGHDPKRFLSCQISGILSGLKPVPISYEDSDQTPLSGAEAEFLKKMYGTGMDFLPYNPEIVYLSDWLKTIWSGDYEGFLKMIEGKSDNELKKNIPCCWWC